MRHDEERQKYDADMNRCGRNVEPDHLFKATEYAVDYLNKVKFVGVEFKEGEPELLFQYGENGTIHVFCNSQATLATVAKERNNDYEYEMKIQTDNKTGYPQFGTINPRGQKDPRLSVDHSLSLIHI